MYMRREKRAPRRRVKNHSLKRSLSRFIYRINALKMYFKERNREKGREILFRWKSGIYITYHEIYAVQNVLFSLNYLV